MRIISIANQKGGCGKTTTAVNLAAAMSIIGKKVLLIDLDPQSHATLGLNIKANKTMYDVLSAFKKEPDQLKDIIINVGPDFDIAPSNILLSTIEQEMADEIGRESRLKDIIASSNLNYEYIVIDCPPNLGLLTINSIRASDDLIIPVEASRFAVDGVQHLLQIVDLIKDRLNHSVNYQLLVTIFDSRLQHSFRILSEMKKNFKDKMFKIIIHINVKLKEAQTFGSHIYNFDKYSRGAKDYYSLAKEIFSESYDEVKEKQASPEIEKINRIAEPPTKTFSIAAPSAREVFLAGEFNNWSVSDESRLEKVNDSWVKVVPLKPGNYRYRFVIDGQWAADPNNPNSERNPFGEFDSIITINESENSK